LTEGAGLNYDEAIEWLFSIRRLGAERTLEPVHRLLKPLGDPYKSFKSIHVTGTNGKGSTSAMIASILRAAGYKVGLFTSPHLIEFTERIVVDGEQMPRAEVVRLLERIRPLVEELHKGPEQIRPLFFDIVTAMAFKYFEEVGVDFAVLEVGMGGRLDATNIVQPLVSVITNVSLEHTEVLGGTVLEIAREKGGIIKPGGVLVTATQDDEVYALFKEICGKLGSRIFRVGEDITFQKGASSLEGQSLTIRGLRGRYDLFTPLLGDHQLLNASAAVGAVEALSFSGVDIPADAIVRGLREVRWPGRLEVMQRMPLVVLDSAKDAEAMKALREAVKGLPHRRLIAVVSISSDKNIPLMIGYLTEVADRFIVTTHSVMGRAARPSIIVDEVMKHGKPFDIVAGVDEAVDRAVSLAGNGDMVLVTGSVFLVGEARRRWLGKPVGAQ
jgi:dihydrofolate synthase/folylpolyglutamate synthase